MSNVSENRREIKITWIKNPSHFAFVFVDCSEAAEMPAIRLEMEVNRGLPVGSQAQGYTPKLHEVTQLESSKNSL